MNTTKYILSLLTILFCLSGCNQMSKKTTLEVVDNNRHYYPVLRGQELEMVFTINNTGEVPFMLTDIYTSCGCLILDKTSINSIPPGKARNLLLRYNSAKNIGYVKHYITIYGNLTMSDKIEIIFDVHVVPNSLYTKDYEELYVDEGGWFYNLADGKNHNKGYYMSDDF